MEKVNARAYCSSNIVLLAFNFEDGNKFKNFLGFAISRTPGFSNEKISWLPNRICFNGPGEKGEDHPSNTCPIQKFMWWDARFEQNNQNVQYEYNIYPVTGEPSNLKLEENAKCTLNIELPASESNGIGTYFNRAVVSSQAFSKKFGSKLTDENIVEALEWLSNGLNEVVPNFLTKSTFSEGAVYHLNDEEWIVPAMEKYNGSLSIVYNANDSDNDNTLETLKEVEFFPRTKTKIMHNKFLVRIENDKPTALLMGSANFTTAGLTTQANLLHTFDSPELANLYLERKKLLEDDPALSSFNKDAKWSETVIMGDTQVRAFFPPEKKGERKSLDAIVEAVEKAKSSVFFCLFSPTDKIIRNAIFNAAENGKMMFGLVNSIPKEEPDSDKEDAGTIARIDLYHRSKNKKDTYSHSIFPKGGEPNGFWWENADLPGKRAKYPVYIHHKFILIDGETDSPIIYTGSANISNAALYNNDENLLEIKGNKKIAQIYLCEFMRLYEHYRARAQYSKWEEGQTRTFKLTKDNSWAKKYYIKGSPEFKARLKMSS